MASTGHLASLVSAMVNVIAFLNGSVFVVGSVSCIDAPLSATLILCFARNHFEYDVPNSRSASFYVNSPTRKKPAKASVKRREHDIVVSRNWEVSENREEMRVSEWDTSCGLRLIKVPLNTLNSALESQLRACYASYSKIKLIRLESR